MASSQKDLDAAIAATRFGLGAKAGEIAAASKDPRGYLKAQIRREGADTFSTNGETGTQRLAAGPVEEVFGVSDQTHFVPAPVGVEKKNFANKRAAGHAGCIRPPLEAGKPWRGAGSRGVVRRALRGPSPAQRGKVAP